MARKGSKKRKAAREKRQAKQGATASLPSGVTQTFAHASATLSIDGKAIGAVRDVRYESQPRR